MNRTLYSAKVLVVGAGPSGLVALKELTAAGIDCVAIDDGPRIGGAFDIERPGSAVYDSTVLTTSNYFMAFSSMALDLTEPSRFWTHREYVAYLRRFAARFDLERHIRFETTLVRLVLDGARVRATIRDARGEVEATFDSVVMASGINRRPKWPDIPGLDDFPGEVLHAADYRNADALAGQRVLCVGLGETGTDVAHEVAGVARDACLSLRHYPAVILRYPGGRPYPSDVLTARAFYAQGELALRRQFIGRHRRLMKSAASPFARLHSEWVVRSGGRVGQWFTKNEAALHDIAEGRLKVNVSGVRRIEGSTAIFGDGERFEADAIVCSTGYHLEWPLPDVPFDDVRDLFKLMIHPRIGTRVVFLGWVRPDLGGVPTCAELQARYLALLLTGRRALPTAEEMADVARADRAWLEARFHNSPSPATVVHYPQYCDDLARLIGCLPVGPRIARDPALLTRLWFGSLIGAHYRLVGPDADFETARRTIMRLPIGWPLRELPRLAVRGALGQIPLLRDIAARYDARHLRREARAFLDEHGGDMMPVAR